MSIFVDLILFLIILFVKVNVIPVRRTWKHHLSRTRTSSGSRPQFSNTPVSDGLQLIQEKISMSTRVGFTINISCWIKSICVGIISVLDSSSPFPFVCGCAISQEEDRQERSTGEERGDLQPAGVTLPPADADRVSLVRSLSPSCHFLLLFLPPFLISPAV